MSDEAFWGRVDTTGDCWIWQGYRNPDGYGRVAGCGGVAGRRVVAAVVTKL